MPDDPPAATIPPGPGTDVPAPTRAGGASSLVAVLRHPQLLRVAATVAWCWPAVVVAGFYLTWFVAWGVLGHRPRPSLDDPKSISVLVDAPYITTGVLFVTFPAAVICGLAVIVAYDRSRRDLSFWTYARCVLLLLAWIAAILFLNWDPLDVNYWFMD